MTSRWVLGLVVPKNAKQQEVVAYIRSFYSLQFKVCPYLQKTSKGDTCALIHFKQEKDFHEFISILFRVREGFNDWMQNQYADYIEYN